MTAGGGGGGGGSFKKNQSEKGDPETVVQTVLSSVQHFVFHCFSCLSFKVPRKLNTAGYVAEIGGNQFIVHKTVTRVLLKRQSEMSPSILLYKHLKCHMVLSPFVISTNQR